MSVLTACLLIPYLVSAMFESKITNRSSTIIIISFCQTFLFTDTCRLFSGVRVRQRRANELVLRGGSGRCLPGACAVEQLLRQLAAAPLPAAHRHRPRVSRLG